MEDTCIAGASAEIASQPFANLIEAGMWVPREQMVRSEDYAGSTDATLCAALFEKTLLDWVQPLRIR
jgi:hypothetical protein